jgi:signal transduction histidine kinase
LQNALKHAGATAIVIQLTLNENLVYLSVADNGKGFERETVKPTGTGLLNIQHRIKLLGGTIAWQKNPEGGTIVFISLPVSTNQAL